MRVHDFLIPAQGKAVPYDVYDLTRNAGWVSVGIDHDTASFAVCDLAAARAWVDAFVRWYNTAHLHSGIRFVTPEDRHSGREAATLDGRREVCERARAARPERWSRGPRCWTPVERVYLNSERPTPPTKTAADAAVVSAPQPERGALSPGGPERRLPAAPRGHADRSAAA